jgi:molybdopterin converting factor subunit 1
MEVTVRYFASHREAVGVTDEMVTIPEGTTVGELIDRLMTTHPELQGLRRDTVVSVNRGVGSEGTVLNEGDDVALFPPIAGG